MKLLNTLILLFTIQLSFAQIEFEPAYYIDNTGEKTECLIKNVDWRDNPSSFIANINGTNCKLFIKEIQEFGFNDGVKYQRHTVDVDKSSPDFNNLSQQRAPEYENKTIFLRVITEGNASLYEYEDGSIIRFFYSINNGKVKPLIYKKFLNEEYNVATNNTYKQQLSIYLKNPAVSITRINNTKYAAKDLSQLFSIYNGDDELKFSLKEEKPVKLGVNARPGYNFSTIDLIYNHSKDIMRGDLLVTEAFKFNAPSVSLGVEVEVFLPFNKNKWALIVEPEYFAFKLDENVTDYSSFNRTVQVDYKSVNFNLGFRYYMFINNKTSVYLNASYSLPLNVRGERKFGFVHRTGEFDSGTNLAAGLGFRKDWFFGEFRYRSNRKIFIHDEQYKDKFNSFAIVLGCTLWSNIK